MNDSVFNAEDNSNETSLPQVAVFGVLATTTYGSPVPPNVQPISQNMVPGVFISADALKELQEKAQNQPTSNAVDLNGNLKVSNYQLNANGESASSGQQSQPIVGDSQPMIASSQPIVAGTQIASNPQPVSNSQQILDSAPQLVTNPQPILSNQQPIAIPNNQNQYLVSQPSNQPNQMFISRPANQPVLLSQLNQPSSNQPVLIAQSPSGQQMLVNPPNQAIYVSQPSNQPIYVSQPSNQPILLNSQSDNQQILTTQSNQPGLVYQNGQPTGNQVTLVARPPNTVQNPGTVYAVVPVNNGQNVPNVNGNTYLLPSNSNQVFTIGTGK